MMARNGDDHDDDDGEVRNEKWQAVEQWSYGIEWGMEHLRINGVPSLSL